MFERFTQSARRVVVLAQEESRLLDHNYIGTEHVLLGLLAEGDGIAATTLTGLGVSLEAAREEVERIVGRGERPATEHIPFTPRAKKVMELSLRETIQLGQDDIGTEHLLLGLLREGEGVAIEVLQRLGTDAATVRQRVLEQLRLAGHTTGPLPKRRRRRAQASVPRCPGCRADLRESLSSTVVQARTDGEPEAVRALFCRRCGRTITVLPDAGGGD